MNTKNTMKDKKSTGNVGFICKIKAAIRKVVDVILYII